MRVHSSAWAPAIDKEGIGLPASLGHAGLGAAGGMTGSDVPSPQAVLPFNPSDDNVLTK